MIWWVFAAALTLPDPLLFAQIINLLHSLQGLTTVHLHHGIQTLLLLQQLPENQFLLLNLSITCGLTLNTQNQLRGTTYTQKYIDVHMIEKWTILPVTDGFTVRVSFTLLSFWISSSCSILKMWARSNKRCVRSRASSSSSVSTLFSLRDRSDAYIWRFLSSAAFCKSHKLLKKVRSLLSYC